MEDEKRSGAVDWGRKAAATTKGSALNEYKIIDGVKHVWSIMDNDWVTLAYWKWVNGR